MSETTRSAEGEQTQFFHGSISKIDRDGREVVSDHLEPGERLRSEVTDRYATAKPESARRSTAKRDTSK